MQVAGAGLPELNGFYRRSRGWAQDDEEQEDPREEPAPEPQGADPEDEIRAVRFDQMRQLVQQDARRSLKPYAFALACWQKDSYTLLLEPWTGGDPTQDPAAAAARPEAAQQRLVLFADTQGVTGYEPFYQAFPDSTGAWAWEVGPCGESPAPSVASFDAALAAAAKPPPS